MHTLSKQRRAAALLSGGLDSLLAAKIILDQGIIVEGINFVIGFGGKDNPATESAKQLGIKLHTLDVIDEFKSVMLNPKYGYGANLNPCLDCKIFMVRKTVEALKDYNFDFIITGEVIGQRPKSQKCRTMQILIGESGAYDLLLRPLCAKCLSETLPEREHWVNRELLYGFNGRSRKPQIELAKQLGLDNYSQPAGGCLLTDPIFCNRMQHLWNYRGIKNYSKDDLALLKIGRHLAPSPLYKIIIGRNAIENDLLEKFSTQFTHLSAIKHNGPFVLLDGIYNNEDIILAARITARYGIGRTEAQVEIRVVLKDGMVQILNIEPISPEIIPTKWFL
jgi:tRNA-uridine 2-sulfurtransferase